MGTVNHLFCASVYDFGFEIGVPRYSLELSTFYADRSIRRREEEEVCNWCDVNQLTTRTNRATQPCVSDTTDEVQESRNNCETHKVNTVVGLSFGLTKSWLA
jgi:hypothetical protein